MIGLPVVTLLLQQDTVNLNAVANVELQLKTEMDANGGKLAPGPAKAVPI